MKALYFAWIRERLGLSEEILEPPGQVTTVAELMDWLKARGAPYADVFSNSQAIRAAADRTHVTHDVAIKGVQEVAFFPPMTGG